MDLRHPLSDFDRMMLEWAEQAGIPAHVLLSKADKLAFGAAKNALLKVQSRMRKELGSSASVQLFSSPKRQGIEQAHACLGEWLFPQASADELPED
jgi:GTP-binding protein